MQEGQRLFVEPGVCQQEVRRMQEWPKLQRQLNLQEEPMCPEMQEQLRLQQHRVLRAESMRRMQKRSGLQQGPEVHERWSVQVEQTALAASEPAFWSPALAGGDRTAGAFAARRGAGTIDARHGKNPVPRISY
jgi:hypothetical protein